MAKAKVINVILPLSTDGRSFVHKTMKLTKRKLANLFRAAAKNLDNMPQMWCKGKLQGVSRNDCEQFCALGMINETAGVYNAYNDLTKAAQRAFRKANNQDIITVNDNASDVSEVTKLMRRAAAFLDHGGSFE